MYADAEGTIEAPDGVMRITKIAVTMHITIPAGKRAEAERALGVFERNCPVHQTLKNCIDITIDSVISEQATA